jgi:hypothetical protein
VHPGARRDATDWSDATLYGVRVDGIRFRGRVMTPSDNAQAIHGKPSKVSQMTLLGRCGNTHSLVAVTPLEKAQTV